MSTSIKQAIDEFFYTYLESTLASLNLASATIQDYCILGTSIVLFMVLGFWEGAFVNRGLELALDVEHIMRLGGWESLDMVLRYTRSVRFDS